MTMPRSVDEILAHADQLAGRFEDYDPNPDDELTREAVTALRAAVQARSAAERELLEAIREERFYVLTHMGSLALAGQRWKRLVDQYPSGA